MSGNRDEPRWWEHPGRKCINDIRFTELRRGRGAQDEYAHLIYLCMNCPVIAPCHADAENASETKYPTVDVIQGGELWR